MIKYFFVLLFIIGCQQNWSINEENNFIDRCKNQKIWDEGFTLLQKDNFCECLLKNAIELELSYNEFLSENLNKDEITQILKPCID